MKAGNESEIDAAFVSLAELHVGALVVESNPFFTERRDQVVALAARYAVPASYHLRSFVTAGGLISYARPLKTGIAELGPTLAAYSPEPDRPIYRFSNRPDSSW